MAILKGFSATLFTCFLLTANAFLHLPFTQLFSHGFNNGSSLPFSTNFDTRAGQTVTQLDWSAVEHAPELIYYPCGFGFECANLTLPIDWKDPTNPNKVFIPILRKPAAVPKTDSRFGGTIIVHSGFSGPQQGGTAFLQYYSSGLRKILDGEKFFELVAFDQRATGNAYPKAPCFQDAVREYFMTLFLGNSGDLGYDEHALNSWWSFSAGLPRECERHAHYIHRDLTSSHQHVSTSLVADDLLAIVDAIELNRRAEVALLSQAVDQQLLGQAPDEQSKKPALLNYWGVFMGTHLGNVFASKYPSRIGRVMLDSVYDSDAYIATDLTPHLHSLSRTWEKFFELCFEAGKACRFFDPVMTDPTQMQKLAESILEQSRKNPTPDWYYGAGFESYSLDMLSFIEDLARPQGWWQLAYRLSDALRRYSSLRVNSYGSHITSIIDELARGGTEDADAFDFARTSRPLPDRLDYEPNNYWSIICGDGAPVNISTRQQYSDYLEALKKDHAPFLSTWAMGAFPCALWPKELRPLEYNRFAGPFGSNASDYDERASPLLFLANKIDALTTVETVKKMAAQHEDARVLVNDIVGHSTFAANPTTCQLGHINRFFQHGTLPMKGAFCSRGNPFLDDYQ